ncbi:MAG TPA: nucleotide exchange factor GrpE [Candidatus Methylomirabilis sp.]|nr:nucleotide exchange factor GrpE [Candidatus Methylomirabilis sp.]
MILPDHDQTAGPASDVRACAGEGAAASAEVEKLRRALVEERQRSLRLLADFDNLRRRMAREREAARHGGRREALLPVLPVLDSLERALAAGSTDPEFYEGVAAAHRLFVTAPHEAGTEPVESVGRPFDPEIHEAVATVSSDGVKPGTIAREVRRGWRLGNEVLRPAQVVVATARESDDPWR